MVWYSHLYKNFSQFVVIHRVKGIGIVNKVENFSQFVVIHRVKGIGIVNKVEVDVFLESSHFFDDPVVVGNLISGSSAFSKSD